ncbi:MAG: HK97 family phage prohead protease [Mycobacterium sp.]
MLHKTVPLKGIKTSGLVEGTFIGFASVFDNLDADGDVVRRGAFAKSLSSDQVTPLIWEHQSSDPRAYVGEILEAVETAEGLRIKGRFDLDDEFGRAAYRNVKARRVSGLSIGYAIRDATKTAAGNELTDLELIEVSVVARGANDRALIGAVKSVGRPTTPIRVALVKANAAAYLKESSTVMTNTKMETLTKNRDSQLALVKRILDAADELGRDLTADESASVDEAIAASKSLDGQISAGKADLAVIAQAKGLAAEIGRPLEPGEHPDPAAGGHLALTGRHGKALAGRVVKAMPRNGTKALASGQQTTSTIVLPDVVETGRPAQSLLDVLPARVVPPSYSFLRQSVRTNLAAPVAEGSLKPTSLVSVVGVENRLRVVAHLSEQIPHYLLSDNAALEQFVADELVWGLRKAVETQVISGDGLGENFTGILSTSGIVIQAFATDALVSVRKGLTILDTGGYEPGVIVLSAADWEAIELLESSAGATDVRGVPIDPVARRLWGVPVVLNQGLGAKTGLVVGRDAVTVDHDGAVDVAWSDAVSDDFAKNFLRCRVEGRFGVSVNQPGAVVRIGTAA